MKRILVLAFCAIQLSCQAQTRSDLEHQIDDLLTRYTFHNRFSGTVIVKKKNKVIYKGSYGSANIDSEKKLKGNSIFNIGSISKPLTAVAVMVLVEKGKFSLDTPLKAFFPDFIPEYNDKILIRHLLNHSSGLEVNIGRQDDQGNTSAMPTPEAISLEGLLDKFKNSGLKFPPGKAYEYNNFGYTLLAAVIEKTSEMSYAEFMQEYVFKPSKMKHSSVGLPSKSTLLASPHINMGLVQLKTASSQPFHDSWFRGAGGIYSTAQDLLNFKHALRKHKLLNAEYTSLLYSQIQPTGIDDMAYGLGWTIETRNGKKWINHDGADIGYAALLGSFPEEELDIVMVSNVSSSLESSMNGIKHSFIKDIANNIIDIIDEKPINQLPMPDNKRIDINQAYRLDKDHSFKINSSDSGIWLNTTGENSWSIFNYAFARDLTEKSKAYDRAIIFSQAMEKQSLDKLEGISNNEMKGFFSSEDGQNQLKGMWQFFQQQMGYFVSSNIYKIEQGNNKVISVRFKFKNSSIGMTLVFDDQELIQGMFMDESVKTSTVKKVELIPTGENSFFINGFAVGGLQDITLVLNDNGITIYDNGLTFLAKPVEAR